MKNAHKVNIFWCHPHFLNWLGGSNYILEIAARLNKKYHVTMVGDIFSIESIKKFELAGMKSIALSGLSTYSVVYWMFLPFFILKDYFLMRKIMKKNDLLITSMFPMNVVAFLLDAKHVQLCFEPYAFFYDDNFVNGFPFLQKVLMGVAKVFYSWIDILATKKAHVVLTLSNFNRNWISKIYHRDSIAVYEGVDLKFFNHTLNKDAADKYDGSRIIFHSTDFTKIKGTEYLFKATPFIKSEVPEVKLLISSTLVNDIEKNRYKDYAIKNGFGDSVEFLGYLDYNLLPAYLSLADVVVQPSVGQSMNLTVKEAMSCRTAVVTSLEGEEQFEDGTAGYLIDPRKTRKLSDKIVQLLQNRNLREKMGVLGRKIIEDKFSWDAVYKRIDNTVSETVKK